jgi:hypothetical protein
MHDMRNTTLMQNNVGTTAACRRTTTTHISHAITAHSSGICPKSFKVPDVPSITHSNTYHHSYPLYSRPFSTQLFLATNFLPPPKTKTSPS